MCLVFDLKNILLNIAQKMKKKNDLFSQKTDQLSKTEQKFELKYPKMSKTEQKSKLLKMQQN